MHLHQPVMCHMSHVTFHMSCVTCQVSHVACHVSCVTFFLNFFLQNCETSQWRVCYQRGLPRLVFYHFGDTYGQSNILVVWTKEEALSLGTIQTFWMHPFT